ncbi:MAG: putative porin, partial [Pseudomonadota bacterium]|nr:putative porin [Pseudomonadota bacterium]
MPTLEPQEGVGMRLIATLIWAILLPLSAAIAQGVSQEEVSTVPPVHILGFADVNYLETEREIDEGFILGQLVGHVSAGLSEHLTLFGEVSATARPDQYRIEVERLFLRYDFNDWFKLSGGRYHTPINWWNTAFHHGLWLQTTVRRP